MINAKGSYQYSKSVYGRFTSISGWKDSKFINTGAERIVFP